MGIPTVEKACIVFDLKTGTIILGVINLIGCIIGTIACLAIIVGYSVGSDAVIDALNKDGNVHGDAGIVFYIIMAIVLAICAFYVFIACLLIQGARTGRPGYLTPWLVLTAISIVLQVLNVIGKFITLDLGSAFSTLVALVVEAYLFVCVHSLKKQLQEGGTSMPMQPQKA